MLPFSAVLKNEYLPDFLEWSLHCPAYYPHPHGTNPSHSAAFVAQVPCSLNAFCWKDTWVLPGMMSGEEGCAQDPEGIPYWSKQSLSTRIQTFWSALSQHIQKKSQFWTPLKKATYWESAIFKNFKKIQTYWLFLANWYIVDNFHALNIRKIINWTSRRMEKTVISSTTPKV